GEQILADRQRLDLREQPLERAEREGRHGVDRPAQVHVLPRKARSRGRCVRHDHSLIERKPIVPDASANALKSKSGTRKSSIFVANEIFELMHWFRCRYIVPAPYLIANAAANAGVVPDSWFTIV